MKAFKTLFSGLIFLALISGCQEDEEKSDKFVPPGSLTGQKSIEKFKVALYNKDEISVGYNSFFVHVVDTIANSPVLDATMTIKAVIPGKTNSLAPFEETKVSTSSQVYYNGLIIDVATNDSVRRAIQVSFFVPGIQKQLVVEIPVVVKKSSRLDIQKRFIVSMVSPLKPKFGRNFFEFATYYVAGGYPVMKGFTSKFQLVSPNATVLPAESGTEITQAGHYTHSFELNTQGVWTVNFSLMEGTNVYMTSTYYVIID